MSSRERDGEEKRSHAREGSLVRESSIEVDFHWGKVSDYPFDQSSF